MATRRKRSRPGQAEAEVAPPRPRYEPAMGWTTAPAWTRDPNDPRNQAARELEASAQRWESLAAARDGDGHERRAARVARALVASLLTGDADALARLDHAATWGFRARPGGEMARLAWPGASGGLVTVADPYPPKGSGRTPALLGYIVHTIDHYLTMYGQRSPDAAQTCGEYLCAVSAHAGPCRALHEAIRRHGGNPDPTVDSAVATIGRYLTFTMRPTAPGVLRAYLRCCGVTAKAATDILAVVE